MIRFTLHRTWYPSGALPKHSARNVSTVSAIRRGIGKSQQQLNRNSLEGRSQGSRKLNETPNWKLGSWNKQKLDLSQRGSRRRSPGPSDIQERFNKSQDEQPFNRNHQAGRRSKGGSYLKLTHNIGSPRESSAHTRKNTPGEDRMPMAIPYTTSASEFIYGRSAVEAALMARRRQLYKLYVYDADLISSGGQSAKRSIATLANTAGVELEVMQSDKLLQKISGGRPTNGLVLEASSLPSIKCTSLENVNRDSGAFQIARSVQSFEERRISGTQSNIRYNAEKKRFPFLLFLDGILDPGNLGAILRSAFFLGADAIVLSSHGSPLTAAALKAASGAAEALPILLTHATGSFIRSSQSHGWRFYAATASPVNARRKPTISLEDLKSPLLEHPAVVILGSEGSGLWKDVESKADYYISINGPRSGQSGVDSLNVSVSAALLTQAFMKTLSHRNGQNQLWDNAL